MPCRRPWNGHGLVSCGSGGGDYSPLLPEERERERGQARAGRGGHGVGGEHTLPAAVVRSWYCRWERRR